MKMIPGAGTISDYSSHISNCTKNQAPYRVPVNSLADVQLYINIGTVKPTTVGYELIHTCGSLAGTIETITPANYVVGQDSDNNWYAVFKNFLIDSGINLSCFVIAITVDTQIYFSEEYCIEPSCVSLTEIKGCYGNLDPLLSYDCEGIYFGFHAGSDTVLGDATVRYEHKLLLRNAEVYRNLIKNTFKQGRTRNFRTEKEKIFQFNAEFIPDWYLDEVDAVFYRGEVYIGGVRYLVNETEFELIEECKKLWAPSATLKESCYKSFSCEADPCALPVTECCDPELINVIVSEVPYESGFTEDSGSGTGAGSSNTVVIQAVVGGTVSITGTSETITGITDGSSVITSEALRYVRVFLERGNIQVPGIDPADGSMWYQKNFSDNFITLNTPLVNGELIYLETIP